MNVLDNKTEGLNRNDLYRKGSPILRTTKTIFETMRRYSGVSCVNDTASHVSFSSRASYYLAQNVRIVVYTSHICCCLLAPKGGSDPFNYFNAAKNSLVCIRSSVPMSSET